jgi:transketolase
MSQTELPETELVEETINTIRTLSMDAVERADSGHPGAPMGLAPAGYLLWRHHLKHNPQDPKWPNRDRFVLSNGHASMLLYSLMYLTGYEDMTLDQIKHFRQWGSITAGHPENTLSRGIETTTGPLGQGVGNSVGMALAEAHLRQNFDGLIDHYTYAFCSDGDLMEGVASEAASLAGHWGLGKLIWIFDDNHITIDGSTDLAFTEDVLARFDAYGWHTNRVTDETDLESLDSAINEAKGETEKPSIIALRTTIGYGSPNKGDTSAAHGAPLGEEEIEKTKEQLGWPYEEPFHVPDGALDHMREVGEEGRRAQTEWEAKFASYSDGNPKKAAALKRRFRGELPDDWDSDLPTFEPSEEGMATRKASGSVITEIYDNVPELIGGSADLAGSNKTLREDYGVISRGEYSGQNIHFGVREHGMGAIVNGLNLHGGVRGFTATFLIFSDYFRPSIRLSALMEEPSINVFTHDSIGLGEDGPTHQPIEQLASLRAIPNYWLFRPADANEVTECWRQALQRTDGPAGLVFTRQSVPTMDRSNYEQIGGPEKGGYVLADAASSSPELILMGTGSEVHVCLRAKDLLNEKGIETRVVSLPCWELFDEQPADWRETVLPEDVDARLAVEAAAPQGWRRYVGDNGDTLGMTRFGASAPGGVNMEKFGFTPENVAEKAAELL